MELLIVIAIIALLVAIVVPSLNAVHKQTKSVVCGSNVKQLSLALTIFEHQNERFSHGFDDLMPLTSVSIGDRLYDKKGKWWFELLEGVFAGEYNKNSVLRCPSRKIIDIGTEENILCGNYGINRNICKDVLGITGIIGSEFYGTPLKSTQIKSPSKTLLIVDGGYSLVSWEAAIDPFATFSGHPMRQQSFYIPGMQVNRARNILAGQRDDAVNGRHRNKKVNIGFADGHLKTKKADELLVKQISGQYKNRSPLWKPNGN